MKKIAVIAMGLALLAPALSSPALAIDPPNARPSMHNPSAKKAAREDAENAIDLLPDVDIPESKENFNKGVEAYQRGDFKTAFELWQPYARAGDPAAQRNLGVMLRKGLGVTQNYEDAFAMFKMSAYSGLPTGMANLALAYYKGEGVEKNLIEARHWFEQASRLNHPLAQHHYAYMLHRGLGGPKDIREAFEWYAVSAFAGIEPSAQMMVILLKDLPPPAVLKNYQTRGPLPSNRSHSSSYKYMKTLESDEMRETLRPGALR